MFRFPFPEKPGSSLFLTAAKSNKPSLLKSPTIIVPEFVTFWTLLGKKPNPCSRGANGEIDDIRLHFPLPQIPHCHPRDARFGDIGGGNLRLYCAGRHHTRGPQRSFPIHYAVDCEARAITVRVNAPLPGATLAGTSG